MGLAPEKVLLKWMNFHLKKAGYKKAVTNFTSDVKVYNSSSDSSALHCWCFFFSVQQICNGSMHHRMERLMLTCLMYLHPSTAVLPH